MIYLRRVYKFTYLLTYLRQYSLSR